MREIILAICFMVIVVVYPCCKIIDNSNKIELEYIDKGYSKLFGLWLSPQAISQIDIDKFIEQNTNKQIEHHKNR